MEGYFLVDEVLVEDEVKVDVDYEAGEDEIEIHLECNEC